MFMERVKLLKNCIEDFFKRLQILYNIVNFRAHKEIKVILVQLDHRVPKARKAIEEKSVRLARRVIEVNLAHPD